MLKKLKRFYKRGRGRWRKIHKKIRNYIIPLRVFLRQAFWTIVPHMPSRRLGTNVCAKCGRRYEFAEPHRWRHSWIIQLSGFIGKLKKALPFTKRTTYCVFTGACFTPMTLTIQHIWPAADFPMGHKVFVAACLLSMALGGYLLAGVFRK